MSERKAITDWLRSRRASEPMRLTIERLADLIDQGKHLEQNEPFDLEGKVKFNKNYYRRMGRKEERERIIKLLQDSDSVCNEWAIALINGENKSI